MLARIIDQINTFTAEQLTAAQLCWVSGFYSFRNILFAQSFIWRERIKIYYNFNIWLCPRHLKNFHIIQLGVTLNNKVYFNNHTHPTHHKVFIWKGSDLALGRILSYGVARLHLLMAPVDFCRFSTFCMTKIVNFRRRTFILLSWWLHLCTAWSRIGEMYRFHRNMMQNFSRIWLSLMGCLHPCLRDT